MNSIWVKVQSFQYLRQDGIYTLMNDSVDSHRKMYFCFSFSCSFLFLLYFSCCKCCCCWYFVVIFFSFCCCLLLFVLLRDLSHIFQARKENINANVWKLKCVLKTTAAYNLCCMQQHMFYIFSMFHLFVRKKQSILNLCDLFAAFKLSLFSFFPVSLSLSLSRPVLVLYKNKNQKTNIYWWFCSPDNQPQLCPIDL